MVDNRLNSIIKFDLHIHSVASKYKEADGIVDNSTKENLDVLLTKLNEHKVGLFSITDHNRFDVELYKELICILSKQEHPYRNVYGVLAGVEFDVVIDEGMDKCHIIAIFDTSNEIHNFERINKAIQNNPLTQAEEFYPKKVFEEMLKEIGLSTILIASQRKDPFTKSSKQNSISDSTDNVEQIIKIGYVNALEFQKPKVEGILLNRLNELSLKIPLFSGSDCHDWRYYPYHDMNNMNKEFSHSKARILPTFKGLLMAITSPETRFDLLSSENDRYIENLSINGEIIELTNGINAIIGENGSGKTTILEVINSNIKKPHVKKLMETNGIEVKKSPSVPSIKYIAQSQIINRFNDRTLFSDGPASNFKEISHDAFTEAYRTYSQQLKSAIQTKISVFSSKESLKSTVIRYDETMVSKNYFVELILDKDFASIDNPHDMPKAKINEILEKVGKLRGYQYFEKHLKDIDVIYTEILKIANIIVEKWKKVNTEINVKNILQSMISDYMQNYREKSTAKDREVLLYKEKRQTYIETIIQVIINDMTPIAWPIEPPIFEGVSKNQRQGFFFNKETEYNNKSMLEDFYQALFNKDFNTLLKVKSIQTIDQFVSALRSCTTQVSIDEIWIRNFENFLNKSRETTEFITEGTSQQIGSTLGEMSLAYYKYYTQDNADWNVLIVDQPEDNISNNNVSKKLVRYFNDIRSKKQVIFVTHNPLLVVNLDVDNVIFVENQDEKINICHGCLEYEDEQNNILEIIASNMDGGRESIEKRLKLYGKNN
jgi:energy-coupling factor transporter ATP-binding protein EcfA2